MTIHFRVSANVLRGVFGAALGIAISAMGCNSNNQAGNGGVNAGTGGNTNAGGGSPGAGGAGGSSVACTPEKMGTVTHSVGNYDNLSCNKADCHASEVGGWVYASKNGYPWVSGATITITNTDGTILTANSAEDGFFDFGISPKITSTYKVCVSKCPSTDCNLTPHTSVDCSSSGCHALPNVRIYVTTANGGGTGGSGGTTGQNCTPAASGGPYVHLEKLYSATSNQACASCHANPTYVGGYLYDGPTSTKTVAGATLTIKPASGTSLTAVTGPDGMFFFGTNGINTTAQTIPVPYTACVSKCPTATLCSETNKHTTNADCGTCHDTYTEKSVYLN
jgi:hypothetical protein